MNIRNDLQQIQQVTAENQVEKPSSTAAASAAASTSATNDQAHLSGAASLASHAASLPDVRADKIQSVQSAIAGGSYSVSAYDVADSVMKHMMNNQG